MRNPRKRGMVLLTVIALLATSGIASAAEGDGDRYDTVFNFDYIAEEQFLIWNVTSIDYEVDEVAFEDLYDDCALEGEAVAYSIDNGSVSLDSDDCGEFAGGEVTGPNGQVNHGMIMKLFNSVYQGPGKGCLIRHLAQSDLGKADDQVISGETDGFEPNGEGDATFATAKADCIRGNTHQGDDDGPGNSANAKEKWGEGRPGKSGSAPGRNK